jgi:hypothetical protein
MLRSQSTQVLRRILRIDGKSNDTRKSLPNDVLVSVGSARFSTASAQASEHTKESAKPGHAPKPPTFEDIPWHKAAKVTAPDPRAKAAAKLRNAFKGKDVNSMPYARCHGLLDPQEMAGFCSAGACRMIMMLPCACTPHDIDKDTSSHAMHYTQCDATYFATSP